MELAQRFWSRVRRDGPVPPQQPELGPCWEWTGSRNAKSGYGTLTARAVGGSQPTTAHRVAWILTNGAIPQGKHVLHRCDNPSCVNPAHLFIGTHTDNMRDMFAKGRRTTVVPSGEQHWSRRLPDRMPRGERHGMAKLNAADVAAIRAAYAQGGVSQQELARRYGMSRPAISAIVTGRHWKEKPDADE